MSFYNDASLVFLPSGGAGKDGKAYSIKPRTGDGDFTFSRGSNLTATRVDSNGLIEKGRENLLLKSNLFDNGGVPPTAWSTSNASVSSGQIGYDGSTDAWLLQANSDGGGRRLQQSKTQGGVSTLSIYAKAGTTDWLRIEFVGASSYVYFDLTNGVLGSETNAIGKIESIGNGWYRCSAVNTSGSTPSTMRYILASANNNVNVVTGDNIYIQDAQLEIGLAATEPILSGASTGLAGILEDSPRFDYSGGASCPSLLLEPSRTNLIGQSEYFGGYSNSNSTDEPNATTSPEGLTNATSFLEAATTGQHKLTTSLSFDGSSTYTFSIFAKTNGRDLYIDTQNSNEWGGRAWFDLTNGTANAVLGTANIEDFGNGWYRCIVTGESTLAGGNLVELLTSDGSTNSTTGDITKGVFIYGAQLEEGSYATSYIPNHSGGSVTREADSCSNAGDASTFNDAEGVLYAEISALADDLTFRTIIINDGSNANRVLIRYRSTSNVINFLVTASSSTIRNVSFSVTDITDVHKVALAYKSGDLRLYIDGVQVGSYTNTFTLSGLDNLSFENYNGDDSFYGNVKQVFYFPKVLSDAECITLTS